MPEEIEVDGEYKPKSIIIQNTISEMFENKELNLQYNLTLDKCNSCIIYDLYS